MTIILAAKSTEGVHFAYDTAVHKRGGLYECQRKVFNVGDAAVGLAGFTGSAEELFRGKVEKHEDRPASQTIMGYVEENPRIGEFVTILLATVTPTPALYQYDTNGWHSVNHAAIGSGAYPMIQEAMRNLSPTSAHLTQQLDRLVRLAKLIEPEPKLLYGASSCILKPDAFVETDFHSAFTEYLERIRKRKQQ